MASTVKRMTVNLDADAADLLPELAGSQRRQGAYLSALIRAAAVDQEAEAAAQSGKTAEELARLRREMLRLAGELAAVTQRLLSLETGITQD